MYNKPTQTHPHLVDMCDKFHTLLIFKYIIFSLQTIKRTFNLIDAFWHLCDWLYKQKKRKN